MRTQDLLLCIYQVWVHQVVLLAALPQTLELALLAGRTPLCSLLTLLSGWAVMGAAAVCSVLGFQVSTSAHCVRRLMLQGVTDMAGCYFNAPTGVHGHLFGFALRT